MSSKVENINTYYVDRESVIHADHSNIPKFLGRLLGRNYDPLVVFRAALKPESTLQKNEIKNISSCVASKLKINSELVAKLFKIFKHSENSEYCDKSLLKLARTYSQDSKKLKSLEVLKFRKETNEYQLLASFIEKAGIISKWNALRLGPELDLHDFFKLDQKGLESIDLSKVSSEGIVNAEISDQPHFFEDVQFIVKTNLIYSIIGFQNSTTAGSINHEIKKDNLGLLIKKVGEWVPVRKLREELTWNSEEFEVESIDNSYERWNYFGNGLVPIDRYYHHENVGKENFPEQNAQLHPVEKLSKEEMETLLTHAKKSKNILDEARSLSGLSTGSNLDKNEIDQDLNCVLQFVTNPRPKHQGTITENIDGQTAVHVAFRIIFSDGAVYSTAHSLMYAEDTTRGGGTRYFLQTLNGQPATMDHEEFRPHFGRIVTSYPVAEERAGAILDQLNQYKLSSLRFNLLKLNCALLGSNVLEAGTGIKLNLRVPFFTLLYRALPELSSIPVVGKFLQWSQRKISIITTSIANVIPQIVKNIFSSL